jgi:predicted ArsR family transcriptional regulator
LMSELAVARALSHELSWKILALLERGELSLTGIRKELRAPTASLRVQLDRLNEAGIVSVRKQLNSSRRNVPIYRLTRAAKSVGYPPRNYMYLSEGMINSLRDSLGEDGARVLLNDIGTRIGEGAVRSLVSRTGLTKWDPSTYAKHFVSGLLADMGFQPDVVKLEREGLIYNERNCLFEDLAVKYPGLVCDVLDKAVHRGIDKMASTKTARIRCKGHGDSVCEYSVKWNSKSAKMKPPD